MGCTRGTMIVPDPNVFGGPVLLMTPEDASAGPKTDPGMRKNTAPDYYSRFKEIPLLYDYPENSRALGLADMCKGIMNGRTFRANSQQQHHVLEILTSFTKSCQEKRYIELKTHYTRTPAMKHNPIKGILDD